jgi:hypothetical protein
MMAHPLTIISSENRGKRNIFILLFLSPIAVTVFLSWHFFIPLPIFDYWDVLYPGYLFQERSFFDQIRFLWEPFVDQRMVFPKIVISYLAWATQNTHYPLEIVFGLLGQCLVLSIALYLIINNGNLSPQAKPRLFLVSSALLFWPNLLLRFQHHWYSTQYTCVLVFAVLSILFLFEFWGRWRGATLSLAFAIGSALSHGTGLIYLMSYMVLLPFAKGWSITQKTFMSAFAFLPLIVIIYHLPERSSINLPPLNWFTEKPLQEVIYILRCFGPEGVLRTQTGFLSLVIGLSASITLLINKKIYLKHNFCWFLIFFWGCSVAFLSGISRSNFAKYPAGIYFSFFVLVLVAVVVLATVAYPTDYFKKKQSHWKVIGSLLVILYAVGAVEGVRKSYKTHRRILWSQERLFFQPILVKEDHRWLFPEDRFLSKIIALNQANMLDKVNTSNFIPDKNITFVRFISGSEIYFFSNREISPDHVITFQSDDFSDPMVTCYWHTSLGWNEEHSQRLNLRPINNNYWILFRNKTQPGFYWPVDKIKIRFSDNVNLSDMQKVSSPIAWYRP